MTARLRQDERGYSLVELLTTMSILSVVLGGVVTLFVAGAHADAEMNNRYRAQQEARVALDRLKRDGHASCGLASGNTASRVTLLVLSTTSPPVCNTVKVTWCALGSGSRYALYRLPGTSVCSAGAKYADYITSNSIFTLTLPNVPTGMYTLARLGVDLRVNLTPSKTVNAYRLVDDVVFRNSSRQ